MNWNKTALIVSVSALAAAAAPASQAQTTVTATMAGLTVTLTDLDPDDGITPALTLTNRAVSIATAAYPTPIGIPDLRDVLYHPGTAHIANGYASAASSYDGVTSSSTITLYSTAPAGQKPFINATTNVIWDFALTPHTSVVFTSKGLVQAPSSDHFATGAYSQLFAGYVPASDVPYNAHLVDDLNSYPTQPPSRLMTVSVSSGDSELDGFVGMYSSAYATALAAPVPEPATYAMLLGGLFALAITWRRNRS